MRKMLINPSEIGKMDPLDFLKFQIAIGIRIKARIDE